MEDNKTKSDLKFFDQWIVALREGEYKQGKECLLNQKDQYCCLGVACSLAGVMDEHLEGIAMPDEIDDSDEEVSSVMSKLPQMFNDIHLMYIFSNMNDGLNLSKFDQLKVEHPNLDFNKLKVPSPRPLGSNEPNPRNKYTFKELADFIEINKKELINYNKEEKMKQTTAQPETAGTASQLVNFGEAVKALNEGKMAQRIGWNGKDMFVFMQVPSIVSKDIIPKMSSMPEKVKKHFKDKGVESISYSNQLAIAKPNNEINGWAPSTSDALANDWIVLDNE